MDCVSAPHELTQGLWIPAVLAGFDEYSAL